MVDTGIGATMGLMAQLQQSKLDQQLGSAFVMMLRGEGQKASAEASRAVNQNRVAATEKLQEVRTQVMTEGPDVILARIAQSWMTSLDVADGIDHAIGDSVKRASEHQ